jgi:DNA-directed RNA polymerase III subunit RPC1
MVKMKDSALMLASFEQTVDHLYDAAYYGVTDDIVGVSESVILGQDVRVGTGICQVLSATARSTNVKPKTQEDSFDIDQ